MAVSLNVIHWQQESNAQDKSSSSLKLMLLAETKEIYSDPVFSNAHTGRSAFLNFFGNWGKLKNRMGFCVLEVSNWFFQFSSKEKTCLLSAVNIEHKNFENKIHIGRFIAFFKDFLARLRISFRNGKKHQKMIWPCKYDFFSEIFMLDVRRR